MVLYMPYMPMHDDDACGRKRQTYSSLMQGRSALIASRTVMHFIFKKERVINK